MILTSFVPTPLDLWQQAIEHGTRQQAADAVQRITSGNPINPGVLLGMLLGRALGADIRPQAWAFDLIDPDLVTQAKNGNWVRWIGGFEGRIDWKRAVAWRQSGGVSDDDLREELVTGWLELRGEYLAKHYQQANTSYQAMEDLLDYNPSLLRDVMGLTVQQEDQECMVGLPSLSVELFYLSCRDNGHWLERSGVPPILVLAGFIEHSPGGKPFEPDEDTGLSPVDHWRSLSPARQVAWNQLRQLDQETEEAFLAWRDRWVPGCAAQDIPLLDWCQEVIRTQKQPAGPSPMSPHAPNTESYRFKEAQLWTINFSNRYPQRKARTASKVVSPLADGVNAYWKPRELPLDPLMVGLEARCDWALDLVKTEQGARHVQGWLDRDERSQYVMLNTRLADVVNWIVEQPTWQGWRDSREDTVLDHCLMYSRHNDRSTVSRTKWLQLARKCPDILMNVGSKAEAAIDHIPVDQAMRAEMKRIVLDGQARQMRKAQGRKKVTTHAPPRM